MDTTARLHDLMAADLEIHKEQAKLMRKGNRLMAAATITLAIILAGSLAGGWWVIQVIQEQNAETLEMIRQSHQMSRRAIPTVFFQGNTGQQRTQLTR